MVVWKVFDCWVELVGVVGLCFYLDDVVVVLEDGLGVIGVEGVVVEWVVV